jgi:hypothetical protein
VPIRNQHNRKDRGDREEIHFAVSEAFVVSDFVLVRDEAGG